MPFWFPEYFKELCKELTMTERILHDTFDNLNISKQITMAANLEQTKNMKG